MLTEKPTFTICFHQIDNSDISLDLLQKLKETRERLQNVAELTKPDETGATHPLRGLYLELIEMGTFIFSQIYTCPEEFVGVLLTAEDDTITEEDDTLSVTLDIPDWVPLQKTTTRNLYADPSKLNLSTNFH